MSEPRLPTKEEIAKLPRWAMVAFAARCARRVLPVFQHYSHSETDTRAVTRAVEVAETFAVDTYVPHTTAYTDPYAAYAAAAATDNAAAYANAAAAAAADAAYAAYAAHTAVGYTDLNAAAAAAIANDAAAAAAAANAAANAARAARAADIVTRIMIARDLQTVRDLSKSQSWTSTTPVSPSVFGPLWPDGPPKGWPEEPPNARPSDAPFDLLSPPAIVIAWDPAVVTPAQYARVVAALNMVVRGHGGEGLKRLEGKPFVAPAMVEEPIR